MKTKLCSNQPQWSALNVQLALPAGLEKMQEIAEEYVAYCEDVMRTEVPKRLNSQFNYCMHEIPFLRGMVLEGLLEQGFLKPEEELSDMIGVYMVVD